MEPHKECCEAAARWLFAKANEREGTATADTVALLGHLLRLKGADAPGCPADIEEERKALARYMQRRSNYLAQGPTQLGFMVDFLRTLSEEVLKGEHMRMVAK